MGKLSSQALARFIDHSLLKPDATARAIEQLCQEARTHNFWAVCVNSSWIELARARLEDSPVKVVSVVGFPLGAMDSDVKRFETEAAADAGAHEIDVVLNIGRLKDGDHRFVLRELRDVVEAAEERLVKVILETALLTHDEKIRACELTIESGAHFVKTSTGWAGAGATVADVQLLRGAVGPDFGVKASGGIQDAPAALALLDAGANRLGASRSVQIVSALLEPPAGHPPSAGR